MKISKQATTWILGIGLLAGGSAIQAQQPGYGGQGYGQPGYGGGNQNQNGPRWDGGPGGWDAPPGSYRNDIQRQGFRDGIEGAHKDFENRRRPNVNNRDEYRAPNVPRPVQRDYRRAFKAGYDSGVRHIMQQGRWPR